MNDDQIMRKYLYLKFRNFNCQIAPFKKENAKYKIL